MNRKTQAIQDHSRRDFVRNALLAGGSLLFLPHLLSAVDNGVSGVPGGRLTSLVLSDDILRLAAARTAFPDAMKAILAPDINQHVAGNTARLARNVPEPDRFYIPLLRIARKKGTQEKPGDETAAIALGTVALLTVQNTLKAFASRMKASDNTGVYLDALVLRYLNGIDHNDTVRGKADDVASLFRTITPRVFTRFHTLIPDDDDSANWVLRVYGWRQEMDSYFDSLANAYVKPERKSLEQVIRAGFLEPGDDLLTVLSSLRRGTPPTGSQIEAAIGKTSRQSFYAKALATGSGNVLASARFINGQIDESTLKKELQLI